MAAIGYKRVIVISVISTVFIIVLDKMGVISMIADAIPG